MERIKTLDLDTGETIDSNESGDQKDPTLESLSNGELVDRAGKIYLRIQDLEKQKEGSDLPTQKGIEAEISNLQKIVGEIDSIIARRQVESN